MFTKLEKAINFKEQSLVSKIQQLASTQKGTEDKTSKVKALQKHVVKEELNLKNQYTSKLNELERMALHANSSEHKASKTDRDDVAFYSNEAPEFGSTDPNHNMGPNYSSVTFNNSVIETIDNARQAEVGGP